MICCRDSFSERVCAVRPAPPVRADFFAPTDVSRLEPRTFVETDWANMSGGCCDWPVLAKSPLLSCVF